MTGYLGARESQVPLLTARESECLHLIAEGMPNKEIAEVLGCAVNTVRGHVGRTLRKLGATNRAHAVLIACRLGLLLLEET
jgi:DNA-binding CsgD family transcriptional regulator